MKHYYLILTLILIIPLKGFTNNKFNPIDTLAYKAENEIVGFHWIEDIGPNVGVYQARFEQCVVDGGPNELTWFYIDDIQNYQNEQFLSCGIFPKQIDTTDMDASTIWYSSTWVSNGLNGPDCSLAINTIQVVRDTLIEDRLCRFLGVTEDGRYIQESEIPFFTKSNKIYFRENNEWKLLYNFEAKAGDTVSYHVSAKSIYYSRYGVIPFPIETGPFSLIVEAIDTVYATNGMPIKRFYTKQADIGIQNGHFMGNIIEFAGSKEKLFGNNVTITPPECMTIPELRCYTDDEITYKFVDLKCDVIDRVDNNTLISGVYIFPNPGMTHLTIQTKDTKPYHYRITNISNQIISSGKLTTLIDITTLDWASGSYIIHISDGQGRQQVQKWVKL